MPVLSGGGLRDFVAAGSLAKGWGCAGATFDGASLFQACCAKVVLALMVWLRNFVVGGLLAAGVGAALLYLYGGWVRRWAWIAWFSADTGTQRLGA
ncbi:hypothetical protein BCR44DRAFT_370860 [Catenaria anguillulae PL171]|uniref:Uncharacterized protein n=1 Tax=Catenaria anguillulae PL171 TaxID=765915 RepID=A0A1Y2HLC7_9FUNG|nr:hypothetical protein BCR44DRAFT_370860 [Catenaria anguillulae PL171]